MNPYPHAPLDRTTADAVFDALVEECSASPGQRADFVHHQTDRVCEEYRFGGRLRFGGKFRRNTGRRPDGTWGEAWYVDAYREDMTDELGLVIAATNQRLEQLRVVFAAVASL